MPGARGAGGCFRPPTVPAGTSRLRLTARASLSDDDLALARAGADRKCCATARRVSILVVTGTGTGVGKTVATAALACHARLAGIDVAVCKPVQTGTADGDDDLAEVAPAVRGDRARRPGAVPAAAGAGGRRRAAGTAAADP